MLSEGEILTSNKEYISDVQIYKSMEKTSLYDLEPIGIGSVLVESLTSYVGRMAYAHNILTGTLITKLLAPAMNKEYLIQSAITDGSRFYESSAAINGLRQEAVDWVAVLEEMTSRRDLRFLTMLSWQDIFPVRNLVKERRTWCQSCLSAQPNGKKYEPLIWNLQIVEKCPIHDVELESTCPICGQDNFVISRRHIPGYCNKCWGWLGMQSSNGDSSDYNREKNAAFNTEQMLVNLKFLIEYPFHANIPQVNTVERLNILLNKVAEDGNISMFAKIIEKPKSTVWGWMKGKNKVTLKDICSLCSVLGITLQDFYLGENDGAEVNIKNVSSDVNLLPVDRNLRSLDFDEVYIELEKYLNMDKTFSMRQIARILNINRRLLYKHYPELCKHIAAKHQKNQRAKKFAEIQADCQKVKEAVTNLLSKGIYPSRRKVEAEIGSGLLRRREVREYWQKILSTSCNYDVR